MTLNWELYWLKPLCPIRSVARDFALTIADLGDVQSITLFQLNEAGFRPCLVPEEDALKVEVVQ